MLEVHRLVGPPEAAPPGVLGLYVATSTEGTRLERRAVELPAGGRACLDTYVNGVPVGYWRAHTPVRALQLRGHLEGSGTLRIRAISSDGRTRDVVEHVATGPVEALCLPAELEQDDVWWWLELVAEGGLRLVEAAWWADVPGRPHLGVAITTHDRPVDCLAALQALAAEVDGPDRVVVVDQGRRRVRDQPGFPAVAAGYGERLTVLEQPNLGGSGGYARGIRELLSSPELTSVVLLDDDVVVEPEAVRRLGVFSWAAGGTIVGGQMLELTRPTVLHSTGEVVDRRRYWWGPAPGAATRLDLQGRPLSAAGAVTRVTAVDFNGWWMCALPTATLRRLGLPLPLFIKWDDVEYGLRAQRAGVPTVTLPGAGVWHVPWTGKDASRDWQAFFLTRNRLVVAALDTGRRPWGLIGHLLAHGLSHLVTMSYSSADMVALGLEEFLAGPERLLPTMRGGPAALAPRRSRFLDARPCPPPPDAATQGPRPPVGRVATLLAAARGAVHAVVPGRDHEPTGDQPPLALALADARWPVLARLDHVWVGDAAARDGSVRRRDQALARSSARRLALLALRAGVRWGRLSAAYRAAAAEVATPQAWEAVFAAHAVADERLTP